MSENEGKYRGSVAYYKVYAELIRAAELRGVTTYQAIAQIMGLPMSGSYMGGQTGQVLGEISQDETRQGRPMLSAIAVGVDGKPGKGFFGLAVDMGKLPATANRDGQLAFWEIEREAVYHTWARTFK